MTRHTYIIIPLKRIGDNFDIKNLKIIGGLEIGFDSDSMSDLVRKKCNTDQGFVRRFRLNSHLDIRFADGFTIVVYDIQLCVFENGIAFLCVLLCVKEDDINRIYDFINQGYLEDKDKDIQLNFITNLRDNILEGTGFDIYVEGDNKRLAIKESYIFNAAFVNYRFDTIETLSRATFNVHKQIPIDEEFSDDSERDIAYTYGARDVENKTYRWGCCISSQSISFIYGPTNSNYNLETNKAIISAENMAINDLISMTDDDIILTVLAMYQKYTCIYLSEQVYNHIFMERANSTSIKDVRTKMLRYKAFGTITPSQISRWNNVCNTYELILKLNGVENALNDIGDKINLLNEEVENIKNQNQNFIATIIAIFGLVSIVASVQQIADYLIQGNSIVQLWTIISITGIALMGIVLLIVIQKKKTTIKKKMRK